MDQWINLDVKDIPVMFAQYCMNDKVKTTEVRANFANWKYNNPDGTMTEVIAENLMHPMDIISRLSRMEVPYNLRTLSFTFSCVPSSVTVKFWPDQYAGFRGAYDIMYEKLKVSGNSIILPLGEHGYVFQVHATWPQGNGNYEFYLVPCMRLSPALK